MNGHLGLAFRVIEYKIIAPGTTYVRLVHPGVVSGVGGTQDKTIRLWDEWKIE